MTAVRADTELRQAWRVYGIVPGDAELPDLSEAGDSVGDRELEVLRHGRVAAVIEPLDPDRPVRRRDLLAHADVLNALVREGPVIPIVFGTAFEERDHLVEELLATEEDALADRLETIRGRAQFQLRVKYSLDHLLAEIVAADQRVAALRDRTRGGPVEDAGSDAIRLGELVSQAVERRLADESERILTQLGRHAEDGRVVRQSLSGATLSLAFLVADDHRDAFDQAAEEVAAGLHGLATVELQGPLAPFDFVPSG